MSFKLRTLTVGILSLIGLSACFGKKKSLDNAPDFGFFKTEGAQDACVSSNVSQWEMTGPYLHKFLRCASNRSTDGAESMQGLQALLASLDEAKLQKVVDFALTVDPNGTTHEERYPYLLALTTVLDRGLIEGRKAGLNLEPERLGNLQDFLVTLDATRSKEIVSTWSRSGQLAQILNEFGVFVESLDTYSLEIFAHEMLSGQTLRRDTLTVARRILREESLFHALNELTAAKPSRVLSQAEQVQFLRPYRESMTQSDKNAFVSVEPESTETSTPLKIFAREHQKFAMAELNSVKDFVLSYWTSYQALLKAERASLDARLALAFDTLMNVQAHPIKWLLAIIGDGNQLKAEDLKRITYAIDQLLLEGSNLSLEAIRAKSGASKLMNDLETLLSSGGEIPGCPYFKSAPLAKGSADFAAFAQHLDALSKPQTDCSNRVPLLFAIEFLTGLPLGENFVPEFWNPETADPVLVRRLTLETLDQLVKDSVKDPYRFYKLQLATDRLDTEFLDRLSLRIKQFDDWSMPGIARLDEELSAVHAGVLETDFIEKLLTHRLESLAVLSHQFADLIPEAPAQIDKGLEARSSRIFAGLYSGGPIEQLIASRQDLARFPFRDDQQDLKAYFEAHPSVWSRLLFKAQEAEGAFRTPALGTLVGETATSFSGAGSSLRNYIAVKPGDTTLAPVVNPNSAHRILNAHQGIKTFSDDDLGRSGWALWSQQFANGPLHSKDVPAELSKKLEEWFVSSLIPTLSDPAFWPELNAAGEFSARTSLNSDYFDIESYSPEEARLLTSYYYKHYQKPAPLAFDSTQIAYGRSSTPKNDTTAFADPIGGFFNSSYLVRDDYESQYTAYAKAFPNVLRKGSNLSSIKAGILPDYASFQTTQASWAFAEQTQLNDVTRLADDRESPFALLSTLDLLSYSKPQSRFIPQSLIGFSGQLCRSKTKDPANPSVWIEGVQACPIDFQGATPNEAYENFREYIAQSAIQTFCPFLASDTYGPRFVWSQRLGLTLDSPDLCKTASPTLLTAYRFPEWHSAGVLNDIFSLGRRAKLKDGLMQVPAAIRYYKIKDKGLEPQREASEFLSMAKGVWTGRQAAEQRRREFFAGNFWVGSPSLLNSYLNFVSQQVDSYTWRTTLISYAERNEAGEQKDTLRDILRIFSVEQKASAAAGESATLFGLRAFDKIVSQTEYRAFTANFLSDLNSSEAYDFYSNEFPMALVQLFPAEDNPFEWVDPGLSFTKNLGQHAFLRSWQTLSELFTPAELDRFLAQTQVALSVMPDIIERSSLITRSTQEILILGTLYVQNEKSHASESLEQLARSWARLDLGRAVQKSWTSLVTKFTLPLQGFDGQDKMSGEQALESLLSAAIMKGPSLFVTLQNASQLEGSALKDEPLFWRNWTDGILASMESEDAGALALEGFLAQRRFGFSVDQGALWLELLRPGIIQSRALSAIEAIDSVPEFLWHNAMLEVTELSGRLTRALAYLKDKLIWNVDPDRNAYRIALDQLYEFSQDKDLREKQLELVTLWFSGEPEAKSSGSKPDQ